ncbi:MAG: B12-binding domain-containing radical SAM protein, partial [Candidatus Zixiibacteriota bacterium]
MTDSNNKNKKVLLIYPGAEPAMAPQMPIGVTVLASFLRKNGFEPTILDARVEDSAHFCFSDYDYIGISSMSGTQLSEAICFAKEIRKAAPDSIMIWGGVHPTFYPEQTIKSDLVDYIVRGEGEITLVELLNSLNNKTPLDQVKGLTYMENGEVKSNEDREFLKMEELDLPAYDLLKLEKYGLEYEYFSYESSRGCPYACTFCYVNEFHDNTWRSKSAEKVLDEIEYLIKTFGAKRIRFIEDLWVVNKTRTQAILRGFIERKFNINWLGFHHARL